MTTKRKDLLSGIFFLALGLSFGSQCLRLNIWVGRGPEAGFWPLLIALVIIVASIVVLANALGQRPERSEGAIPEVQVQKSDASSRVGWYSVLLICYGALFGSVGFVITTCLFLFFSLKYVESQSWRRTFLLGGITIVVGYILFYRLLGVPLPKGVLKWW
jgi:putative tricarboxylic transport membrane protein